MGGSDLDNAPLDVKTHSIAVDGVAGHGHKAGILTVIFYAVGAVVTTPGTDLIPMVKEAKDTTKSIVIGSHGEEGHKTPNVKSVAEKVTES